jgi:hypothetical protein
VRTPVLIAQLHPAVTDPKLHVKEPGVVGRVSLIVTFVAVPKPLFVTATV